MLNRWLALAVVLLFVSTSGAIAQGDSLTVSLSVNYSGTFGAVTFTPATLTISDLGIVSGQYVEQFELKSNNSLVLQAVGFDFNPTLASTLSFGTSTNIGLKGISNTENQDPDSTGYGLFNVALSASGKTPSSDTTWTITSTQLLHPSDFLFPSKPPIGKSSVYVVAEFATPSGTPSGQTGFYWAAAPTPEPTSIISLLCISIFCTIVYSGAKFIKTSQGSKAAARSSVELA